MMDVGGYSATGPREANEDSFFCRDFSEVDSFTNGVVSFVLVSDGMGGYQCGDVASQLAVASAESYVSQLLELARGNQVELDPIQALREIAVNAHDAILAESSARGHASMGATLVAAFVSATHAWVAHLGDSRCYLIRGSEARQVTEDHSRVGRMLAQGVLTEQEAQTHPERNKIERALGFSDPTPEIDEIDLVAGDALLLCSDGVSTVVDAASLASCVAQATSATAAAEAAVALALKHGTDDNSTAVVLRHASPAQTRRLPLGRREGTQDTTRATLPAPVIGHDSSGAETSGLSRHALALIVLLAGILVGVIVMIVVQSSLTAEVGGGAPAPHDIVDAISDTVTSQTITDAPDTTTSTDETEADGVDTDKVGEEATYVLQTLPAGSAAELKYVDESGMAQLFSYATYHLDQVASLQGGMRVNASVEERSFGRYQKRYLTLADAYLDALRADVSACREGATTFDSLIASVCEPAGYAAFVTELADAGPGALDGIACLIFEMPDASAIVEDDGASDEVTGPSTTSASGSLGQDSDAASEAGSETDVEENVEDEDEGATDAPTSSRRLAVVGGGARIHG